MKFYEFNSLLETIVENEKLCWEQTRFLSYITAQVNSRKKLKVTDILKFGWDDNYNNNDISTQNIDIKSLREKLNELENEQNS